MFIERRYPSTDITGTGTEIADAICILKKLWKFSIYETSVFSEGRDVWYITNARSDNRNTIQYHKDTEENEETNRYVKHTG